MFVDSHAHLDSPDFQPDLEDVLQRAKDAGVSTILTIGCVSEGVESIATFLRLLEDHDCLYGSIGVHPHDARFYHNALGRNSRLKFVFVRIPISSEVVRRTFPSTSLTFGRKEGSLRLLRNGTGAR